jgi:F-type H+-transporting ATPase subunit delta
MSTVSATYARALLQAADARGQTAALLPWVATLAKGLAAEPTLVARLADPRRTPAQRQALAGHAARELKLPALLANLLQLLAANRRVAQFPAVLAETLHLANRRANLAEVRVETAAPLTEPQKTDLKRLLKTKLKAADVLLTETANPGLIGGFRAFAAGRLWDCSLKGRLTALSARFSKVIDR